MLLFRLGILIIFFLSLALRFWNLGQFNTLVFDEVYYAKFANNYLTQTPFFNSHPPLTEYLVALGMWVGSFVKASPDMTNNLTGSWRSTFSYRWLNALVGSFFPLILGAIAYQLNHRRSYSLIVVFVAAVEGLFLVESRYALNNIYLVNFGLLGCLFFLLFLNHNRYIFLAISGFFFGLSPGIKWNGLGFLLGIYLLIGLVYLFNFQQLKYLYLRQELAIFENITKTKLSLLIFNLLIIPVFVYSIIWLPYLLLNNTDSWWGVHQKIWSFHQSVGSSSEVHPYCSKWYSWLVMARPIAYFYETKNTSSGTIIYNVHALGNPILWWFSTVSVLSILLLILLKLSIKNYHYDYPIFIFILINYFANLLPWIKVSRCTFLYHYMSSYSFALLSIAWVIEQCLKSSCLIHRRLGIIILFLITVAFIYWLPIYLGLPLSQKEFNLRMLLHWI
ncbi:MAG: phospholipid carrier-dependent glycosyltransferase [Crocosphaera sp.]